MKGQVSAPIELLIAVFVMGLSMSLAFLVLNQTNEKQCFAELKTESLKLQAAMQNVALGNTPTSRTITFRKPSSCGSLSVEGIRIIYYSQPEYCGLCPNSYGSCWQIVPISYDVNTEAYYPIPEAITCVDISGRFEITDDDSCALSENPAATPAPTISQSSDGCPPEDAGCNDGIPDSINPIVHTIGKTRKGYEITLTKGISSGGGELGQVKVCVKEK